MKDIVGNIKSILGLKKREKGESLPFALLFSRFREVLENNNAALEIITDMGEKLGGDYIFDIVYVKGAYANLSSAILRSIQIFDSLTTRRYPALHSAFELIDTRIRTMVYDDSSPPAGMVLPLEDVSWDLSGYVGGKSAGIAELKNYMKLDVPESFVITTGAYDEFLKLNGLDAVIEEAGRDGVVREDLHGRIMNAAIPAALDGAIEKAADIIRTKCGECFLAVRSSAQEEDGEFSFAGQFETALNVPFDKLAIENAYKRVVASLFSPSALSYQTSLGYPVGKIKMAVTCMVMVDAEASGVVYSSAPEGGREKLMVNAAPGLGTSVVEGKTDADLYIVRKQSPPVIELKKIGGKESMVIARSGGGVTTAPTPERIRENAALADDRIVELAGIAMSIEKHFRKPMDIEWATDKTGKIFLLQARPLAISDDSPPAAEKPGFPAEGYRVLLKGRGAAVLKGAAGGRVFVVRKTEDLANFPKGAVLVAKHDSPDFVRVMPFASAVITDTGAPTSHMASLCREFKVPTVVNTGDATSILKEGEQVTLHVDEEGRATIYEGIVRELIRSSALASMKMERLYEYRRRRYILRYISPLNLVDPLLDNFNVDGCKTMHDILRFIHEKSVAELIEGARYGDRMLKKRAALRLDIQIPAGIIVIDIGGGLKPGGEKDKARYEDIASIPFRAVVKGMTHPGVWHSQAVSLKVNDFISSMMRMPDITADRSEYVGYNVAVISREYANLSLRFGYHFNMLDCYCSERARNNHIYFRFVGGATDISKRSRRIQLISDILKEYGFNIMTKGDLIIARLANIGQDEMETILDQTGRLIAFTRQLDAMLHNDASVELYRKKFLEEKYDF